MGFVGSRLVVERWMGDNVIVLHGLQVTCVWCEVIVAIYFDMEAEDSYNPPDAPFLNSVHISWMS